MTVQQGFEERYLDVLQNLEAAILQVYHRHPNLLDSQVNAALEMLLGRYTAEQSGRTARPVHLDGARQEVFLAVEAVCEWRLGRGMLDGELAEQSEIKGVEEIVACLKRIRKSVERITKECGRQGYVEFISGFL